MTMAGAGSRRAAAAMVAGLALTAAVSPVAAQNDCTNLPTIPNMFNAQLKPVLGPCSGNGECINNVCVCYEGFTGRSDFLNTEGEDCQINTDVIRGLWSINLILCLINFGRAFPSIKMRWDQFAEVKARKNAMGEQHSMRRNRGLAALLLAAFIMYPAMAGMAILMLVRPEEERVGITPGATVFFGAARISFYTSIYLFQPALIGSLLKGSRATQYLIHRTYVISAVLSAMGVLTGILPFIELFAGDNGKGAVAQAVYLSTMGLTLLQIACLGIQAQWTKGRVVKALDMSYELTRSDRTLELKAALVAMERENVVQTGGQALIYIVLVFVPYVANFHSYWLPVGWFAYIILGVKVAKTTIDNKFGTGSKSGTASTGPADSTSPNSGDTSGFRAQQTQVDSTTRRYEEQVTSFVHMSEEDDDYV
ncbi:Hypothetical Protein FCC1311_087022 [Hondaea fermentalgiana]|uniref:Uncharacterized protein n=1 Tax=Hondaea fermentalgiana TaxID=2315210 RepID=A0A2R5GNL2_9STRA|nr:Hypothetical Protein FCC1311_087022 [Hondaea fermentalgiana]|eukprot:GBG32477.1 Hypothetical Protein FCC1311_087022 [Hondaea fermentalgiana]